MDRDGIRKAFDQLYKDVLSSTPVPLAAFKNPPKSRQHALTDDSIDVLNLSLAKNPPPPPAAAASSSSSSSSRVPKAPPGSAGTPDYGGKKPPPSLSSSSSSSAARHPVQTSFIASSLSASSGHDFGDSAGLDPFSEGEEDYELALSPFKHPPKLSAVSPRGESSSSSSSAKKALWPTSPPPYSAAISRTKGLGIVEAAKAAIVDSEGESGAEDTRGRKTGAAGRGGKKGTPKGEKPKKDTKAAAKVCFLFLFLFFFPFGLSL